MPIIVVCPSCGKRLQVRDELAGRRVACPGCKTVLSAPAAAPPLDLDSEPAPTPVRPPVPAAADNPFTFSEPAARKPAPALVRDNRYPKDEDEYEDEDEDRDEVDRRPAAKRWAGFGSGCGLVGWGLWVEWAAILYWAGLIEFVLASSLNKQGGPPKLIDSGGPFVLFPMFFLLLIGTTVIGLGRLRMLSLPAGTGASGVLGGAAALTGLRGLALLAGTVFIALAGVEWLNKGLGTGRYVGLGGGAYLVAVLAGVVAELSVIPGVAVAGGAMPRRRLMRRAGLVSFILQLLALVWVVLIAVVYFVVASIDLAGPIGRPAPGPAPRGKPAAADPDSPVMLGMAVGFVILIVQSAYTLLHYSLYAAGRSAAQNPGADAR
ncbi:MAG TPA: hypothetical protein VKE74_20350 [Gemmataceae bacterium]|nr:hypothetical protein [Gemmataceae bacterium]